MPELELRARTSGNGPDGETRAAQGRRPMDKVQVERFGGFGGFGLPGGRVRSIGECALSDLSAADRAAVTSIFSRPTVREGSPDARDGFRYKLTLLTDGPHRSVELPEAAVPVAIRNCAVDRLV